MQKILSTFAAIALLTACNPNSGAQNAETGFAGGIMGGDEVASGAPEAKSLIFILMTQTVNGKITPTSICTGTLIGEDTVLTAAHCVSETKVENGVRTYVPLEPKQLFIVWGTRPMEKFDGLVQARSFKIHEKYMTSGNALDNHDVAVLKFKGQRPAGTEIAEMPAASDSKDQFDFTAIGYGRNVGARNDPAGGGSGILRILKQRTGYFVFDSNREFAVDQRDGKGVCSGDSGGPAMVYRDGQRAKIMGIASRAIAVGAPKEETEAPDFNICKYVTIYSSVAAFRAWIDQAATTLP